MQSKYRGYRAGPDRAEGIGKTSVLYQYAEAGGTSSALLTTFERTQWYNRLREYSPYRIFIAGRLLSFLCSMKVIKIQKL